MKRLHLIQSGYAFATALILFAAFDLQLRVVLNDDSSFYLIAAQRLLEGGRYLTDIYDINPPLIVLLSIPAVLLAKLTSIPLALAFVVYVYGLIVLSLVLIWRVVPLSIEGSVHCGAVALMLLALCFVAIGGYQFGEREHLICILASPWLCLVARRWSSSPAPSVAATVVCSFLAAIGLALKPFFVPLFLGVLAVDIYRQRSLKPVVALESLVIVFSGVLYLLAVWVLFPEWLTIAADGVYSYRYLEVPRIVTIGTTLFVLLPAGLLLSLGLLLNLGPQLTALFQVIALAVGASAFSPVIQNKNWNYHFLPLHLELWLLSGLLALLAVRYALTRRWPLVPAIILLGCGTTFIAKDIYSVVKGTEEAFTLAHMRSTDLYRAIHDKAGGASIMSISASGAPFQLIMDSDAQLGSRFLADLDLPYVTHNLRRLDGLPADDAARVRRLDAFLKSAFVEDIHKYHPKFILFETTQGLGLPARFDLRSYLMEDRAFATEMRNYTRYAGPFSKGERVGMAGRQFEVFELQAN